MRLELLASLVCFIQVRSNYVYYEPCDNSLKVEGKGEDVVDTCLSKISEELSVTSTDFSLMRRLALVESNFGENEEVVSQNNDGGIWQITSEIFQIIKENKMKPEIKMLTHEIEDKFGYECFACEFNFSTPMRSALAARIFINYKLGSEIPHSVDGQATWWSSVYHNDEKDSKMFEQVVNDFEGDYKMEQKQDLWFMLDGSESVTGDDFQESVSFACSTASKCSVSMSETRCGISVFSESNTISQSLDQTTTYDDFYDTASALEQPQSSFSCGNAFQEVLDDGFGQTYEGRWESSENTSKCIFLITDRESTDDYGQSITNMQQQNVSLFTIAVGSEINKINVNKMTEPFGYQSTCFQSSYDNLKDEEISNSIFSQFCNASQYTEEDIDMICVVICQTMIQSQKDEGKDTSELENEVLEIFYVNCSTCKNYSDQEADDIKDRFSSGEGKDLIDRITNFQNKHSNSSTQSTTAAPTAVTDESLCGDDFKSDVWLLYDASPGMDVNNLEKVKIFYETMISRFNVSSEKVQLGMSKFAAEHEIVSDLKQPTDYNDFRMNIKTVSKYPEGSNIGKSLLEVLEVGFNDTHGARMEENIKRSLVMVVGGNSTDDITAAADLVKENNISVFAVGIGESINTTMLNTLASEPVSKHVFKVSNSNKLRSALPKMILETVSDTPINVAKNGPVDLEIPANSNREISTTVNRNEDLSVNITSNNPTATIVVFVKVGKVLVNSANFDAKFTIRNGSGDAYLKTEELLKNYPDITNDEIDLSIAITTDKEAELKIKLGKDERNEVQKVTEDLDDLAEECDIASNKTACYKTLEEQLNEANSTISTEKQNEINTKIIDFKKEDIVNQINTITESCEQQAKKANCVKEIEDKITEASDLGVSPEKIKNLTDEKNEIKKEVIIEEAKNKTEECKTATNKTACYKELEDLLDQASNLNVSITALEESREAVDKFKEENPDATTIGIASDPPGTSDFQTFDLNFLWLFGFLFTGGTFFLVYYRKKKKREVKPMEEDKKSILDEKKSEANEDKTSEIEKQSLIEENVSVVEDTEIVQETKLTLETESTKVSEKEEKDKKDEEDEMEDLDDDDDDDDVEDEAEDLVEDTVEEADDDAEDDMDDELDDEIDEDEIEEEEDENLEIIEEKVKALTEEAKQPYASFDSVQELRKVLATAEKAGISTEILNSSKVVMKELEKKIEQEVLENVQELTEKANNPNAPIECLEELKEQLEIANGLGITSEEFNISKNIVEQFDKKIENANNTLDNLEKVLSVDGPTSKFKEAEFLKKLNTIKEEMNQKPEEKPIIQDTVVKKLKKTTDQAKKSFPSKKNVKKIKAQLKIAEVLEVPDEDVEEFQETAEEMEETLLSIESANELLKKAVESEDSALIEEALLQAESIKLPGFKKDEDENVKKLKQMTMQAKKKYVKALKTAPLKVKRQRNKKIEKLIADLEQALPANDNDKLKRILDNVKKRKIVFTQNPKEKNLKVLIRRAERQVRKNLRQKPAAPKEKEKLGLQTTVEPTSSSEPVEFQLEDIDDSPELTKLEKINKAVQLSMSKMDLKNLDADGLIAQIEKQFGNLTAEETEAIRRSIDRFKIILYLKRSIGFRSDSMIKSALEMKDELLATTMKDHDIEADQEMSALINRANELRLLFEKVERMKATVMSLKQPTISEVRSYSNPPKAIRNVMEATFVLLGEEMKKLKSWQSIKALIGKSGKDALKRRIWERDLEFIDYSSAKTAQGLLEGFAIEDVEVISSAGSVFYSWSMCVIQEVIKRAEEAKSS